MYVIGSCHKQQLYKYIIMVEVLSETYFESDHSDSHQTLDEYKQSINFKLPLIPRLFTPEPTQQFGTR